MRHTTSTSRDVLEVDMSAQPDWDPRSREVLGDQLQAYDGMRRQCPVAYSDYLQWSLFGHADVMRVLADHRRFSNAVSGFLSVPNGMDPPVQEGFRKLIDPYFGPGEMAQFSPLCRRIADELVRGLPSGGEIELMTRFAEDFAAHVQCAFMGWSSVLHEPLRRWTHKNREATLARDREAMARVAQEFDGYIREQLDIRRKAGSGVQADVTSRLLAETIDGRPLTDAELVSIIRNWTVGELSTISACIGILVGYLAQRPGLQRQLREQPALLPAAIDEILRMDAPLISNRRIALEEVELGGRRLAAGSRITLMWASANRDAAVCGDPDEFRLDRDPAKNLLYGAGVHMCPGAPLARLELQVLMEALLSGTSHIAIAPGKTPVRAHYPAGGFSSLPLRIEK